MRPLTVAPDLDGWAVVERLLEDLSRLPERIWLVINDLHELGCGKTLALAQAAGTARSAAVEGGGGHPA